MKQIRIDIDKNANADICMDSFEYVKQCGTKFDTIIFDPPYNFRKSREKYNGNYIGSLTKIKNEISITLGRTHFYSLG